MDVDWPIRSPFWLIWISRVFRFRIRVTILLFAFASMVSRKSFTQRSIETIVWVWIIQLEYYSGKWWNHFTQRISCKKIDHLAIYTKYWDNDGQSIFREKNTVLTTKLRKWQFKFTKMTPYHIFILSSWGVWVHFMTIGDVCIPALFPG